MKKIIAALTILLSSNLAAQDDQFKIKGFYADMPLEEFEAVAESHGALFQWEEQGLNQFIFDECAETRTSFKHKKEVPAAAYCEYPSGASNLTVAGFDVYQVTRAAYEAPHYEGYISFKFSYDNWSKLCGVATTSGLGVGHHGLG